jgi:hypothetical protein
MKQIGDPARRMANVPIQNFYFLWSVERVGVIYNVPTIGTKDWYRWGAEILVANQGPQGSWPSGGKMPGDEPIANTCLALLFLRGANLAAEVTSRLPFSAADLIDDVTAAPPGSDPKPKLHTGTSPLGGGTKAAERPIDAPPVAPSAPAPPAPIQAPAPTQTPTSTTPTASPSTSASSDAGAIGGGARILIIVALIGGAVVLLAGGGLAIFFLTRGQPEEKRKPKRRRRDEDYDDEDSRPQRPARSRTGKRPRARYDDD